MENCTDIEGNQNIVIQDVSDSTITIEVDGNLQEINKRLDDLMALLQGQNARQFLAAGKAFDLGSLSEQTFRFIVDQARADRSLPEELQLITERNRWVQSLGQELQRQRVPVRNNPAEIINYYGWLIETHLQKMLTKVGRAGDLRAFSFMTEAWFSSLRYLCYIQMAQLFKHGQEIKEDQRSAMQAYFALEGQPNPGQRPAEHHFDYLSVLVSLASLEVDPFIEQMEGFLDDLLDTESNLYATMLFLESQRNRLLDDAISEDELPALLPQYLTGLTYWLRKLAFLAHYRLVSIKDINLSYRLGTPQSFVHLYGELHGMYDESFSMGDDYNRLQVDQYFTYNHSVLLFRGNNITECLGNLKDDSTYLSLSPLVIDQSVYANKETQTPEIYYYLGQRKNGRRHFYAQYKNELPLSGQANLSSNKNLEVAYQNDQQPKLDELYEQLTNILTPYQASAR